MCGQSPRGRDGRAGARLPVPHRQEAPPLRWAAGGSSVALRRGSRAFLVVTKYGLPSRSIERRWIFVLTFTGIAKPRSEISLHCFAVSCFILMTLAIDSRL